MKITLTTLVCFLALIFYSCQHKESKNDSELLPLVNFEPAQTFYLSQIDLALQHIDSLAKLPPESEEAKKTFKALRTAFKKAEPYASYLNPAVGHRANGPALPIFTDDTQRVLNPLGLQKIEESIYEGGTPEIVYKNEVSSTRGLLEVLKDYVATKQLNPQRFFIATHQQLFRIISLGVSGFDTPVSQLGLEESAVSLKSLYHVYELSLQNHLKTKSPELDSDFKKNINSAVAFLENHPDFESFDRYTFIRDYMNPITHNWVEIRKKSDLWEGVDNQPFNYDAPTFFEKDAFNTEYFIPPINRNASKAQFKLGEKLFFDKNLSANGEMACATCHIPEKGYADGLTLNIDNNGELLERNTPTLINSIFQKSFFWDGRSASLQDQITMVFNNEKEFSSNVHQFSTEILTDTTYHELFQEAFGRIPKKNTEIVRAISSYVSTLNGFDSKFDRNMRAEENTYTAQEKHGFNLFMGKALCATCHFIPLTNGTVPPFFSETEKEVIGVPDTSNNLVLDEDLGFYWRHQEDLHRGMFKTPTVRNVTLTAPYMHNGVYENLEEVVNFYNLGGGGGLGFDNMEHQTLPFDNLNLTSEEQSALVAFMETLTDDKIKGLDE